MAVTCAECGQRLTESEARFGVTRCDSCTGLGPKTPAEMFAAGAERPYVVTSLQARGFRKQESEYIADRALLGEPVDPEALQTVQLEAEQAVERDSSGDFLISAVASAIGGGATWATFAAADPGGTFFILWGPAVYGAWKFLQGAVRYVRYPTGLGLVLGMLALGTLAASGVALAVVISQSESNGSGTTSQNDLRSIDIPDILIFPRGQTSIYDVEGGDCLSDALGGEMASVTLVPCDSSEATARVTMQFDVARDGSYPGISYFDAQVESRCPLAADWYLHPSAESWAEGDRQIICLRSLR